MIKFQHSSGNPIADKRANYAKQFALAQDFAAAVDVMTQALEIAPNWAAGWFSLGEFSEKLGNKDQAISAYTQALNLSPADYLGSGLKLSFLAQQQLQSVPSAYAEALFDDYAVRFDNALVTTLLYCAPEHMAALLNAYKAEKSFANVLDLGCGTGLMGAQLRHRASHLIGIDISASMLEQAKSKQIYDSLLKADICDAVTNFENIDLVTAADVFMYLPNLAPVFRALSNCLVSGGLFLFCTEAGSGPEPWKLRHTLRHAHTANYIQSLTDQNNLKIVAHNTGMIRMDEGQPVVGNYYLAVKQTEVKLNAA